MKLANVVKRFAKPGILNPDPARWDSVNGQIAFVRRRSLIPQHLAARHSHQYLCPLARFT